MSLLRLRGRKVCDRLLRQGHLWKGKHLQARWMAGHPRHPAAHIHQVNAVYAGAVASAKLDASAVRRNRMRRRCREALRHAVIRYTAGPAFQVLLLPRASSLTAPFTELETDVQNFLSMLTHGRHR